MSTEAERYRAVKATLVAALERTPQERPAFLDEACAEDADLRREVESLLAEEERAAGLGANLVPPDALAGALGLASGALAAEDTSGEFAGDSPFASEPGGAFVPTHEEPAAGLRMKQFELVRELGQGGMGRVFLARDTKLGRPVALKFLKLRGPRHVQRFLAEARATAQCQHENIVVIYEASEAFGRPYLALEYLDGEPLGDRLAAGPLAPAEAIGIGIPVVRALVRAHALGIVHRDLKPDNIFLTRDGTVKVLDFGIAKLFENEVQLPESAAPVPGRTLTRHGQLVGTVPYMSPEQWGAGEVDHRTDLWAVGILFWHMLTQRHPVRRPHHARLKAALTTLDEPLRSIGPVAPGLSKELVSLVDRCLAKHKEERFASAAELLAALEALHPAALASPASVPASPLTTPATGDAEETPLVLRVTAAQAWGAMFVLGWLLLGMALGWGVGTSYVASINWGPNYIALLPLLVGASVRALREADAALGSLSSAGMLLDDTGHFASRNDAWRTWRRRLASPLGLGVPLVGGVAVSFGEWWQRFTLAPVPGEWWTEAPLVGAAGAIVQGLVFSALIIFGLGTASFTWTVRELWQGQGGVRLGLQEHAEDGQGGFGLFATPIEASLLTVGLLYVALWLSSVESMALALAGPEGPLPLSVLLTEGGLFSVGPAHYSTRMTGMAVLVTFALLSVSVFTMHRIYWAVLREHAQAGGSIEVESPWLVRGLRLDVLVLALVVAMLCFVFYKLGLVLIALATLALAWRGSRVLRPD